MSVSGGKVLIEAGSLLLYGFCGVTGLCTLLRTHFLSVFRALLFILMALFFYLDQP